MADRLFYDMKYPSIGVVICLMLVLFFVSTTTADLNEDLVGYWPLDGNVDDAVNKHDGQLEGGSEFVDDPERGEVLEVDGTDGRAVVPHDDDLIFTMADSYTLSVWVNVLTLPGHWAGIVNKSRDAGPWYGLWINPQNQWVAGGTNIVGSLVEAKVWNHAVLVQDGNANTRVIYVNGEEDFRGTAINAIGGGDLWMGGAKSVNEFLHGRIDDVFLYARALSEAEIDEVAEGLAVQPRGKLAITWGELKK